MPNPKSSNNSIKSAGKAINISARISQEDAEFLARYKAAGCVTPSDKLRAILTEARERNEKLRDFRGSIDLFHEMLAPIAGEFRELELTNNTHSELISRVLHWLPDMLAFIVSSEVNLDKNTSKQELVEIEAAIADRIFRLIESTLQMGITKRSNCYDVEAISSRLDPILDIAKVIRN